MSPARNDPPPVTVARLIGLLASLHDNHFGRAAWPLPDRFGVPEGDSEREREWRTYGAWAIIAALRSRHEIDRARLDEIASKLVDRLGIGPDAPRRFEEYTGVRSSPGALGKAVARRVLLPSASGATIEDFAAIVGRELEAMPVQFQRLIEAVKVPIDQWFKPQSGE
jgi:hypothetical protein